MAGMSDAANVIPDVPAESAGTSGTPEGALSFLSGSWINTRVINVMNTVQGILDNIIDKGLLVDGFAPFESPLTDEMLLRMSPDQLETLMSTIPSVQEKADCAS